MFCHFTTVTNEITMKFAVIVILCIFSLVVVEAISMRKRSTAESEPFPMSCTMQYPSDQGAPAAVLTSIDIAVFTDTEGTLTPAEFTNAMEIILNNPGYTNLLCEYTEGTTPTYTYDGQVNLITVTGTPSEADFQEFCLTSDAYTCIFFVKSCSSLQTNWCSSGCGQECAGGVFYGYHDSKQIENGLQNIVVIDITANEIEGVAGFMYSVLSHEIFELMSDPVPARRGWRCVENGNENSDICNGAYFTDFGIPMQLQFSRINQECAKVSDFNCIGLSATPSQAPTQARTPTASRTRIPTSSQAVSTPIASHTPSHTPQPDNNSSTSSSQSTDTASGDNSSNSSGSNSSSTTIVLPSLFLLISLLFV